MATAIDRRGRRSGYSGTRAKRLWHLAPHGPLVIIAVVLACAGSGCSTSYQLSGLWGKADGPAHTGSVSYRAPAAHAATSAMPSEADLAFTRSAIYELLSKGDKMASVPWENPRTGARGTVSPVADAYAQDGFTCQNFLASYVRDGAESWLQGEACRANQGKWEVKTLRPWKQA